MGVFFYHRLHNLWPKNIIPGYLKLKLKTDVDHPASLMLKEKSVLNIFYCLLKRIRIKIKYSNNCHAYTFRTKENIV